MANSSFLSPKNLQQGANREGVIHMAKISLVFRGRKESQAPSKFEKYYLGSSRSKSMKNRMFPKRCFQCEFCPVQTSPLSPVRQSGQRTQEQVGMGRRIPVLARHHRNFFRPSERLFVPFLARSPQKFWSNTRIFSLSEQNIPYKFRTVGPGGKVIPWPRCGVPLQAPPPPPPCAPSPFFVSFGAVVPLGTSVGEANQMNGGYKWY